MSGITGTISDWRSCPTIFGANDNMYLLYLWRLCHTANIIYALYLILKYRTVLDIRLPPTGPTVARALILRRFTGTHSKVVLKNYGPFTTRTYCLRVKRNFHQHENYGEL